MIDKDINSKRLSFIQYLNTVILTIIGLVSGIIAFSLREVKKSQDDFAKQLIEIKTIQNVHDKQININDSRVKTLELNYVDLIKTWVDNNYVRKPQKQ